MGVFAQRDMFIAHLVAAGTDMVTKIVSNKIKIISSLFVVTQTIFMMIVCK